MQTCVPSLCRPVMHRNVRYNCRVIFLNRWVTAGSSVTPFSPRLGAWSPGAMASSGTAFMAVGYQAGRCLGWPCFSWALSPLTPSDIRNRDYGCSLGTHNSVVRRSVLGGQPCNNVPSQTLGISCWQVPTLQVLAALSPSTVRVDGLVAAPCHAGRVHLRSGLVPLSAGRSCSSDPRWPWRMRATTTSCAGSRRGPGAGESPPAPWSRSPNGGRS